MDTKVIARIPTLPAGFYYTHLSRFSAFLSFPMSPGSTAELILKEKILAGPVTAMDYFKLQNEGCEPLLDFGLFLNPYVVNQIDTTTPHGAQAALIHAPYVMLTRRPLEEFDSLAIGVSSEVLYPSNEAFMLAKILLSFYWEVSHKFHMNLDPEDDVWLVPGGPYMGSFGKHFFGFPYAYDLTWEYYRWKKTPFILYRWVCSPNMDDEARQELIRSLRLALELGLRNLSQMAASEATLKGLNRDDVLRYVQGFGHRLGLWMNPSENNLRSLIDLVRESELTLV